MKRLFIVLLVFVVVCLAVIALNMQGSGPW
jgi:hypothetical protein